ncbi:GNAT family N-acetyltransferase [Halolamina litorea]|uniref:GNAT family N-acetyltransferase n=1 Tax=Halolamina litorea TaxID=1515593 RepID=A0ABD6BSE2_9EURY
MALDPASRDRIADRWAERLGCSPEAFHGSGVTAARSTSPRTVRLLRHADAMVVATPQDADGAAVASVHGLFVLAYVDAAAFSPVPSDARLLAAGDEAAFAAFRARVPDADWRRASPTFRPGRTAGLFRDGDLVATATLGEPPFPDVGVVVAPERRGRGHGRAVVSRVTAAAFEADPGAVVRYRTPASASLALAESLGYERWAASAVLVLDQTGTP